MEENSIRAQALIPNKEHLYIELYVKLYKGYLNKGRNNIELQVQYKYIIYVVQWYIGLRAVQLVL